MIAPAEPVLGRLPTAQVAGSVPQPAVRNDATNNPPYATDISDQAAATANAASAPGIFAPSTNTNITAFPSLFLAQLIGQGSSDPQTQGVINSYAQATPQNTGFNTQNNYAASMGGNPAGEFMKTLQGTAGNTPALSAANNSRVYAPQASAAVAATAPPPIPTASTAATPEKRFAGNVRTHTGTQSYRGSKAYGATLALDATSPEQVPPEAAFA